MCACTHIRAGDDNSEQLQYMADDVHTDRADAGRLLGGVGIGDRLQTARSTTVDRVHGDGDEHGTM